MGQPKLLLPFQGRTIIEQVIAAWRASRAPHVVVVTHPADTELARLCREGGVHVYAAEPPPPDMKASVLRGLQYTQATFCPAPNDAWLVCPADIPRLTPSAIDAVLDRYNPHDPQIVVPRYGEKLGHPVLFPWSMAGEVARLSPEQGINALLAMRPVCQFDAGDASLGVDVDTPEEYQTLCRVAGRQGNQT